MATILSPAEEDKMNTVKLTEFAKRFAADDSGLSAVEYGLLAAGIVLGITLAIGNIGSNLTTIFNNLSTDVATAAGS